MDCADIVKENLKLWEIRWNSKTGPNGGRPDLQEIVVFTCSGWFNIASLLSMKLPSSCNVVPILSARIFRVLAGSAESDGMQLFDFMECDVATLMQLWALLEILKSPWNCEKVHKVSQSLFKMPWDITKSLEFSDVSWSPRKSCNIKRNLIKYR